MSNKIRNIENRGWEGMSELLDKHLPQEKKRRQVFPFWSATAAASLVIISSFFLITKEGGQSKSDVVSVQPTKAIEGLLENNESNIVESKDRNTQSKTNKENTTIFHLSHSPMIQHNEVTSIEQSSLELNQASGASLSSNEYLFSNAQEKSESHSINDLKSQKELQIKVAESITKKDAQELSTSAIDFSNEVNVAINTLSTDGNTLESMTKTEGHIESIEEPTAVFNKTNATAASVAEEMTYVSETKSKNDLYLRPSLNAIFNLDDKTKSGSIGLDIGYKIRKTSIEFGGEYISNNAVNLTSAEVKDFVSNRSLSFPSPLTPIQSLSDLKSSSTFTFNNGTLVALNAKIHYDISKKIGLYVGAQLSQSASYQHINITANNSDVSILTGVHDKSAELNILNSYGLANGDISGNIFQGRETTGFSYLLGLSYKVLKRLHINIGLRSNYRPKDSINEYAVAHNLPLITVGGSYKMF